MELFSHFACFPLGSLKAAVVPNAFLNPSVCHGIRKEGKKEEREREKEGWRKGRKEGTDGVHIKFGRIRPWCSSLSSHVMAA